MIDESVAFALAQPDPVARGGGRTGRPAATLFVLWNIGAVLGVLLGGAVGDPDRLGLDAAVPGRPVRAAAAGAARPGHPRVALAGAAVAVVATPFLPAGLPVLLALGGLAVLLVASADPRRCAAAPTRSREVAS